MTNIDLRSAKRLVEAIRLGEVSIVDVVEASLNKIKELDKDINAFITINSKKALAAAESLDTKLKRGEKVGALCGLPIAVKDVISTAGLETTCGSKILKGYIPPYDATVVAKLKEAGAVIVGKTNTDEFAMGSTTEFSAFGPTRNPVDKSRVAGGSSGGSGAAVAAGMVPLSLGSDTGGSIRCPAAFCGVVGLKPTYGSVSRYGLISYANSLEQIGPFAANVDDCALLFQCISGWDPMDSTSYRNPPKVESSKICRRVAVPKEFFGEGVEDAVARSVWRGIEALKDGGYVVEEVSLSTLDYALPAYYIIAMAEASSNLARFDGLRYGLSLKSGYRDWNTYFSKCRAKGFGPEVKRRILLGTYVLSAGYYGAYYLKAQKIRNILKTQFQQLFTKYGLIAGPTMPTTPFKIGEKIEDPLLMYMIDINTVPPNLTGHPAISVPVHKEGELPVGLQIIAPYFCEERLFQAAKIVEEGLRRQ
ncbi:MAG: Asp-tRNA(Asn)/Glu-tRNA(Gln) amidotransferase subunit GatA [Nitrososphaerales archaeon]